MSDQEDQDRLAEKPKDDTSASETLGWMDSVGPVTVAPCRPSLKKRDTPESQAYWDFIEKTAAKVRRERETGKSAKVSIDTNRVPDGIPPVPRGVVMALAEVGETRDMLAAWDAENEARQAAEAEVTRLTQENARLKAEIQRA